MNRNMACPHKRPGGKTGIIALAILFFTAAVTVSYSIEGVRVGYVDKVNAATGDIIVRSPDAALSIKLGDTLYVRIKGEAVLMQATFPMQTCAKCRLAVKYAASLPLLAKGMQVYRYDQGVEVQSSAGGKTVGGMELVYIAGGEFMMGAAAGSGNRDETPPHKVAVKALWMGKYEVTQKQYEEVTGTNPSYYKGDGNPVEMVSWLEAAEFCNKLSLRSGLVPAYLLKNGDKNPGTLEIKSSTKWTVTPVAGANGFRLPTEAEWEFACRGGSAAKYFWGDEPDSKYACFAGTESAAPVPSGQKLPNAFGLYDMSGNVWEWCHDWYEVRYYKKSPVDFPQGPDKGKWRVLRGGSWADDYFWMRSSVRWFEDPTASNTHIGFRVALPAE